MTDQSTPLKVCYYNHCARLGGAEIALLRVLASRPDGATVVVGEPGRLAELLRSHGVRVISRPLPWRSQSVRRDSSPLSILGTLLMTISMGWYVARLALWLRGERPDVVHLNSLRGALIGGIAARLAGIPAVWHAHDTIDESYLPGVMVRLVRALVRTIPHAVVANSNWTLSTLRLPERFTSAHPVAVVPPPLPQRAAVPARRGDRDVIHLLMAGRLAHWKGQDLVLDALSRLRDLPWRMRFAGSALFGEDEYAEGLSKQVTDLGLADRVTFVPFAEDIASEYRAADVLLHYSRSPEPFGMVVTEGLSHRLVVIAADAGGPAEVIEDGVNGLLVRPGDPSLLAAVLRRVIEDDGLREQLSLHAADGIDRFHPAEVARRLSQIHAQVAGRFGHLSPPDQPDPVGQVGQATRPSQVALTGEGIGAEVMETR